MVMTRDNTRYICQRVICSIPLPAVRALEFDPPLSQDLRMTIDNVINGKVRNKVLEIYFF